MTNTSKAKKDEASAKEPTKATRKATKKPSKTGKEKVIAVADGNGLNIPTSLATEKKSSETVGLEAPPEVTIPEERVGENQLEKARRVLQGIKGKAAAVRQWMLKTGLPFIRQVDDIVEAEGEDYLDMTIEVAIVGANGQKSVVQKPGQVRKEFSDSIENYLNWPENGVVGKLIRRAGHLGVIIFKLGRARSQAELHEALADIYQLGYLDEATDGDIRGPGGKQYRLTDDSRFGELGNDVEGTKEIVGLINGLLALFRRDFYRDAQEVRQRLQAESQMSAEDLCNGEQKGNNLCALWVRPTEESRKEEILQVRLDEGRVWPIAGSGHLQETVAALQDSKAFVLLPSFFDSNGKLEDRPPHFTLKTRLGEWEFKRWLGLRIKLWYWIRQGIANALVIQQKRVEVEQSKQTRADLIQKLKEELIDDQPLVDESKWLSGHPGDTILAFEDWHDKETGKRFDLIVARVRRQIKGEGNSSRSFVGLVNTSAGSAFFDGISGECEEGERFQGVKEPLGRFLRALYGMQFGTRRK